MPFQFGGFQLPTIGDAVNGGEAIFGNLIEGVIEGVTGEKVELTPGNGIDNTRVDNGRGRKGDLKFEQKMASHVEVEKLRRELEKELNTLRSEVTKLKVRESASRKFRPAVTPNPSGMREIGSLAPAPQANSMNPMLMLMMSRDGDIDPLMAMMLMQNMGSTPVGSVGGQPMQMDPMAFAMMQMFSESIRGPRVLRQTSTPKVAL